MKAIQLAAPGGLERLQLVEMADPSAPEPGEIRVRLHASSLNFHDYGVVSGSLVPASISQRAGAHRRHCRNCNASGSNCDGRIPCCAAQSP